MMLNSKSIGNKIAEARKRINLSQSDLAQQISISPQAVGKWERGESMPDIMTLNRLAEIFGVDLNHFVDRSQVAEAEVPTNEPFSLPGIEKSEARPNKKFDWNWDMSRANWVDADFSGLKNLKEKFSSSNMKNCRFANADLSELILGNNNIESCDFSSSDFRNSKIQASNLSNNQFNHCSFIDSVIFKNNIEKCNFSDANFSGLEMMNGHFDSNLVNGVVWKFTSFKNTSIRNVVFDGTMEDCHFEHCAFHHVTFQNATILNTFFKYNEKLKRVEFIDCKVDSITYAFLKNNQANLSGITLLP